MKNKKHIRFNHRILIMSFVMSIVMILSSVGVFSQNVLIYESKSREIITKGLIYEHKSKFTEDGWVDIHVLLMDLEDEYLSLEILRSMDEVGLRQTLSGLAEESEANILAGVNASFFNMTGTVSEPLGVYYDEGFGYADQHYNTIGEDGGVSLIQTFDNENYFDFFGVSVSVYNENGRRLYLSGINRVMEIDGPALYNRLFGEDTSRLDELGRFYKVVVNGAYVVQVAGPDETIIIPELDEGYIITIPEAISEIHLSSFGVGKGIDLQMDSRIDTENIRLAITGGAKILEDGALVEQGMIIDGNSRHPRTALGLTADGKTLVAMIVDGRGSSIGATHKEMAQYLLEYNVSDAIHYDGGGSSTMLSRSSGETELSLTNIPSDGTERRIINGIGFASTAPLGSVKTIKVLATTTSVFKNNPIQLTVIGLDENYNPVEVDTKKIVWGVEGLGGTWGNNVFTPTNAGVGTLTCYYEDLNAKIVLTSRDSPIDLNVSPRVISMDYLTTSNFSITGVDENGYEGAINLKDVTYVLENSKLGYFVDGVFHSNEIAGVTRVRISVGGRETSAYIVVGSEKTTLQEFETTTYKERSYPENLVSGSIHVDTEIFVDTDRSYRFDYSFTSSADSQAFYMMLDDFVLTDKTDEISLNVYGNNSGQMLKALLKDANDKVIPLTFTENINFEGWKELTVTVSDDIEYPIRLDRIYVVALQSIADYDGTIYIDGLSANKSLSTDKLRFDEDGFVSDPLMLGYAPLQGKKVSLFGATAGRNRLLDNVLLQKVYETMNETSYGVFVGDSDVNKTKLEVPYTVWSDKFGSFSVSGIKFITLGTSEGGLRDTDYTQFASLNKELATTVENQIVILGDKNPIKNFDDEKEGELLHNILRDYSKASGKTIIYVNGSGYETDVTLKEGIRYIDTSGLWYQINDRYVDLNKTFYTVDFYIINGKLKYRMEPLYSLVEVKK